MRHVLTKISKSNRGSIAIISAVVLTIFIAFTGFAIDMTILNQQRSKLQHAADTAALASVVELGIASTKLDDIQAIATEYFNLNFRESEKIEKGQGTAVDILATPSLERDRVTVDIHYAWVPFFAHLLYKDVTPINVSATAALAGNQSICVIALADSNEQGVAMNGRSFITANACGIYANSLSPQAISIASGAKLKGSAIFSSGGYVGNPNDFTPTPIDGSPPIMDPLDDRPAPTIGACTTRNLVLRRNNVTLSPGTYCGGIQTFGNVNVKLLPGDYIIKDGPLVLSGNSTLTGEDVGFYFTGTNAVFSFEGSTNLVLKGRRSGPMAGLLFHQDRTAPLNRNFVIASRDAEQLEGTIYLPRGNLVISQQSKVGQRSAWTAIIARKIATDTGPDIAINSDYSAATVPIPDGIGPTSGQPRLIDSPL